MVGFERILKFLFDSHVHYGAYRELKRRGVDVEHVLDVGLGGAPDEAIMAYATRQGRIVVTRDYHDFVRLLVAYVSHGLHPPSLLLLSKSVAQHNAGAQLAIADVVRKKHVADEFVAFAIELYGLTHVGFPYGRDGPALLIMRIANCAI